jgi:predicted nucleotidyltransferase/HEPN domain-containing protein
VINLTKILSYLPKDKIRDLETITQRIVNTGLAEIVILFGSYARGNYKVIRGKERGKKSDYDILVVVSENKSKKKLNSELRGAFTGISTSVQLIVETIDFVNSNLEEKQFFFTDIKREGKILYNSGMVRLSESKELTPTQRRKIAEEDFKEWYNQAKSFHRSANHDMDDKELKTASFHFQQVAEMCYTAIEMVFTHYNPHEHNLLILRDRTIPFDSRIKEVLPYNTEEEQELFDYLNFAYIGGRYRSADEFPVTREHLDYWSREAGKLLDLTETICRERIECLKGIENNS